VINIFEKEKKLINLIKQHQQGLERGKFLDPFFRDEITVQKLVKLFSKHNIDENKSSKILDILWKEIKQIFKRRDEKISFIKKEEVSLKRHLLSIKKIITQDRIRKIDMGQYLQLFKPQKTLGKNNDKWLDTIDAMIEHLNEKNKELEPNEKNKELEPNEKNKELEPNEKNKWLDPKSKVPQIVYFVTSVGMKLEKIDPKFRPSTYFNEAKQTLSIGGEIIYIVANFYDKRITKRSIKSALHNYKRKASLIRQLEGKK